MNQNSEPSVDLRRMLEDLADPKSPIRGALVYRLSEPTAADMATISELWDSLPTEKRRMLISRLLETSETSFDVDFADVALMALNDPDALVRQSAVATLWPNDEPTTMRRLLRLIEQDESPLVRAAAAEALGPFILGGELNKLDQSVAQEAEELLLTILKTESEPLDVQRRSLESLAYSGREEVSALIKEAHSHRDVKMQASAIFAMGRSADERWSEDVIQALSHPDPAMRYEAAKATGELGLSMAVDQLIEFALEDDHEIRNVAIWSLGEIGGTKAEKALLRLAEDAADEDLVEALEDAIASAQLGSGFLSEFNNVDNADDSSGLFDEQTKTI